MSRKLRVCLLASHTLVLSEFHRLLGSTPFNVQARKVQPMTTGSDAIIVPRAEVYVMDYDGDGGSVPASLSSIMRQDPQARVLLVGDRFDDVTAFPLLRLGVKGLLEHAVLGSQLKTALQSVARGGYWVPRALLSRFVDHVLKARHDHLLQPLTTRLSRREKEVADALLENLSNKEIANKLNISERTVKFHVSNLLEKFGVQRRADLIVLRYQQTSNAISAISSPKPDTVVN